MQKALQLASIGAPYTLGSRPIPKPTKDQILVKILAAALNPIDAYVQARGFMVSEWPIVCGWDAAGVVEEVGEGVVGFAKGDRV